MPIRKLVSRTPEIALSQNDLERIVQVMPVGSTVDLAVATAHYLEYNVTYGQVVPRLTVLPDILKGLRVAFRNQKVDMTPTKGGLSVRVYKLGVVK